MLVHVGCNGNQTRQVKFKEVAKPPRIHIETRIYMREQRKEHKRRLSWSSSQRQFDSFLEWASR